MPILMRQVEAEMSHDEVKDYLIEYLAATPPVGVTLVNEDNTPGEGIEEGDYLIPKPETYTSTPIVPGTYVYVVQLIPRAGVFLGVFVTVTGQRGYSLMRGGQFIGKHPA